MKTKPLSVPVPVRAVMPMGGWQSCLPPTRRNPPVKRSPLDNLSDSELLKVGAVVDLLKHHDWYYSFSDDIDVFRRGKERELALQAALAALPLAQAEAIWTLYAPSAFGSYRRS